MKEFIDDNEAWKYLRERGFESYRGVIFADRFKRAGKVLEKGERQAIEYLINEWDWKYAGEGVCCENEGRRTK